MDANSNKHQKHNDGDKGKVESGLQICDLHNSILQEIISNLPTKEAVRTSILSKTWKDQWKGISKIELEEELPGRREQFIAFVEKLLVDCNPKSLKKFTLICEVGDDAPRVNEWLSRFINPNLEEVNLGLERVEQQVFFPEHMFTSKKLIKFELSMQHLMKIPTPIHFQSLRILTLKYIIFPDTFSTQELFRSWPSLEELTLIDCDWRNVRDVSIASPSLQKVIIREWKDDEDGDDGARYCQIVVAGSNLRSFSYDGDLVNDYFLYCSTSMKNASVEVHRHGNNLDAGYVVLKLLKALTYVEKLSITDFAVEALSRASFFIGHIPQYHNLVELNVVSVLPIDLSCEALLTIMRNSPCLEVVDFLMGVSLPKDRASYVFPLPHCFGTYLKTIRIYGFTGQEAELNAINFLLQEASVLETLYIYSDEYDFDSPTGVKTLDELYEQIAGFPRVSEDCDIYLE